MLCFFDEFWIFFIIMFNVYFFNIHSFLNYLFIFVFFTRFFIFTQMSVQSLLIFRGFFNFCFILILFFPFLLLTYSFIYYLFIFLVTSLFHLSPLLCRNNAASSIMSPLFFSCWWTSGQLWALSLQKTLTVAGYFVLIWAESWTEDC